MKKVLKAAGIILGIIIVLGVVLFSLATGKSKDALSALTYDTVDMNTVTDGTYNGETDAGLVKVKVAVTVKDHAITAIDIVEHQNGLGGKAEVITTSMIEKNTYDVDAVSGATLSSEAIKSAVSKALGEGSR